MEHIKLAARRNVFCGLLALALVSGLPGAAIGAAPSTASEQVAIQFVRQMDLNAGFANIVAKFAMRMPTIGNLARKKGAPEVLKVLTEQTRLAVRTHGNAWDQMLAAAYLAHFDSDTLAAAMKAGRKSAEFDAIMAKKQAIGSTMRDSSMRILQTATGEAVLGVMGHFESK